MYGVEWGKNWRLYQRFTYHYRAYDTVNFRLPKNGKELVLDFIKSQNISMNDFFRKMLAEEMQKAGYEFDPNLIFPQSVMPDEFKDE